MESSQEDIQASRNLSEEEINATANALGASLPEQAQAEKLIDGVIYENEYKEKLKLHLDLMKMIKSRNEAKTTYRKNGLYKKGVRDRIAVIYAQGPVLYGEGSENIIGKSVFEAIDDALKNRRVKASFYELTLLVEALSSDIIWNALMKAKKKNHWSFPWGM